MHPISPMRYLGLMLLSCFVLLLGCGGGGSMGGSTGLTGGRSSGGATSTGSTTGGSTTAGSTTGGSTTGGTTGGNPDLGIGANLNGYRPFPSDNPWNTPLDAEPVDPNSSTLIASIGATKGFPPDFGADWNGGPFGIPYVVVDSSVAPVAMHFDYAHESGPGRYPFSANAPVEGGNASSGDRHVLALDRSAHKLFETFSSYRQTNGSWNCAS